MKKASFVITLSLITVFLTGHYFIYTSVLKAHKNAFKTYIRTHFNITEQIEISPSELYTDNSKITWHDENTELCLNGVMYDILSIQSAGTKVVLNVVNDTEEKALMDRYQEQFDGVYENINSEKKENHPAKDFYGLKYLNSEFCFFLKIDNDVVAYTTIGIFFTRDYNDLIYSPPEVI